MLMEQTEKHLGEEGLETWLVEAFRCWKLGQWSMQVGLSKLFHVFWSEDSKEESAEKHQKMISEFQKDKHDDRIIIYTDGSKSETNQIGAGLVYTTNTTFL